MELLIAPKIALTRDIQDVLTFLDIDLNEVLNAVLSDMRVFESDVYSSLTERAINRAFSSWSGAQYDAQDARVKLTELERQIKQWLFTSVDFDILCYFYCREFRFIESNPEQQFSTYYLEMDALYNDIYRSNPAHIRESLCGYRARFLSG